MTLIAISNTQTTPNYSTYKHLSEADVGILDAVVPLHKRTIDTIELRTSENIGLKANAVKVNGIHYFVMECIRRVYLDRLVSPPIKTVGYATTLRRDALTTLLMNSGTINGYLLKQGFETQDGLYAVDTRLDTIVKYEIHPTYGFTVLTTRAAGIEDNTLTIHKQGGDLNAQAMYAMADSFTTPDMLGTFVSGYTCVTSLGFDSDTLAAIANNVRAKTGSANLTMNTSVNINILGTSISFTLGEALSNLGTYRVEPQFNIYGDITGVLIGNTLHTIGVLSFGPVTSEYKSFLQKQDNLGTLSWDLIWATMLNILNLAIPSTVFELPAEFKSELGWTITKHFYGGFDDLAPIKYMKAQGVQWSFDNPQAIPSFIAYNLHNEKLQKRARLIEGVETTDIEEVVDLATYLKMSHRGMIIQGIVTEISPQLTAQEQNEIRNAFEGGIRVL